MFCMITWSGSRRSYATLRKRGIRFKLNTGNPAPFGLFAPDEIIHDMKINLNTTQGYCDSKGLFSAVKLLCSIVSRKISGMSNR
jgi:hypothetical protein